MMEFLGDCSDGHRFKNYICVVCGEDETSCTENPEILTRNDCHVKETEKCEHESDGVDYCPGLYEKILERTELGHDDELIKKTTSLIDSYCEHEAYNEIEVFVDRCGKCGELILRDDE